MWLEFLIEPTHTVESNCCCSCCGNNKVMTLTRKVRKTSRRKRKRRHHKHCNEKETDNNYINYSNNCKYVNMNNNHNRNNHYHTPSTLNASPAIKASHNINLCVQNDKSGNNDKEDNHCDDHRNDNNEVVVNSVRRRALAKVHCIYNINKCSSKNTNNNNNTTYNMNIKQQSKQGHHLGGKSNNETGNTSCNFKIAHVGKASKEEILLATCLMPKDNAYNINLAPPTPTSTTILTLPVLKQLSLPTPSKALTSSTGLTIMETARVVPISSTTTTAPNATEQVQLKQKDRMQTKYIHGLAKYATIATTTTMRTIILSKSLNLTTHSPFRIRSMLKSASMLETPKRRYKTTTARTAFRMSVQHGRYGLLGIPWLPSLYETWCTVIFATLLVLSICHNNGLQASALTEQVSLNKARPSDVENSSATPRFQLNKHPPNNSLHEENIQEKEQPQISQQLQIPQRWQHIQHTNNHFIYRNEQQQQEHMLGTEIAYGYDLAALDETNNTHSFQSLSIIDGGEELAVDGSPTFWKHMTGYNEDITFPAPMHTMPVFDFGMPRNITARTGHTEAIIKCRVDRLHDKSVSWIRKRDLHILTVGTATYTSDKRFQVTESKDSREWTLHVKSPQTRDSGIYECQVNTEPKISMAFQLNVIEISPDAKAIITGPADLHFKVGSAIILTCLVQQPSVKDIGPIYWYRGEYIITPFNMNDDDNDDIDDNIIVTPSSIQSGMLTQSVASNIAHKSSLSIINAAKLDVVDNYSENEQLLQQILTNEINQDFAQRIAMESQLGDIMKSRLRISNAQASDTGNYTCQPTTASSASVMVHVINDENPAAMQKSAADSLKQRVLIVDAVTIFYTLVSLLLAVSSVSIPTLSKFLRYLHLRKGICKIRVSSIERQQLLPPHCWRKLPSEPPLRIIMKIIVVYNLRQENSEQAKYICKHTHGAKCVEENVARHNHKNSDNLDGIIIISIKVFCKEMKTVHL